MRESAYQGELPPDIEQALLDSLSSTANTEVVIAELAAANPRHAARIRAVGSWLRRLSVLALEADGRAAARPSVMDALEREADVRPRVQLRQLTGGVESPGPEVVGTPANGRVDASCHLAGRWATGVRWRRDTDEAATRQRSADSSAGRTTRAQPS